MKDTPSPIDPLDVAVLEQIVQRHPQPPRDLRQAVISLLGTED